GSVMSLSTLRKWTAILFLVLLLNTAFVWTFAFPTVFYMANVVFHLALGAVLFAVLTWLMVRDAGVRNGISTAFGLFLMAFVLGVSLAGAGNTLDHRRVLWAHIGAALAGTLALAPYVWHRASREGGNWLRFRNGLAACIALLAVLPASVAVYQKRFPPSDERI